MKMEVNAIGEVCLVQVEICALWFTNTMSVYARSLRRAVGEGNAAANDISRGTCLAASVAHQKSQSLA
jgi:hypothetical protein